MRVCVPRSAAAHACATSPTFPAADYSPLRHSQRYVPGRTSMLMIWLLLRDLSTVSMAVHLYSPPSPACTLLKVSWGESSIQSSPWAAAQRDTHTTPTTVERLRQRSAAWKLFPINLRTAWKCVKFAPNESYCTRLGGQQLRKSHKSTRRQGEEENKGMSGREIGKSVSRVNAHTGTHTHTHTNTKVRAWAKNPRSPKLKCIYLGRNPID